MRFVVYSRRSSLRAGQRKTPIFELVFDPRPLESLAHRQSTVPPIHTRLRECEMSQARLYPADNILTEPIAHLTAFLLYQSILYKCKSLQTSVTKDTLADCRLILNINRVSQKFCFVSFLLKAHSFKNGEYDVSEECY